MGGPGPLSAERSHIDDPAACAAQRRNAAFRNQERRAHVYSEYRIPLFRRVVSQFCRLVDTGIVDEEIDSAELSENTLDGPFHAPFLTKIAFDGNTLNARALDVLQ